MVQSLDSHKSLSIGEIADRPKTIKRTISRRFHVSKQASFALHVKKTARILLLAAMKNICLFVSEWFGGGKVSYNERPVIGALGVLIVLIIDDIGETAVFEQH